MESTQEIIRLSADRQAELRVWLIRNGMTYAEIGRRMGITSSGVLRLVQGERMPTKRHSEMVGMGIPADLLPQPLDVPFGPPRKHPLPTEAATVPA